MIKDIIPPGALSPSTRLVLANTVYFEAKWHQKFLTGEIEDGPFYRLDGSFVIVPLMHRRMIDWLGYTDAPGWQAVELPYRDSGMAMLVILPETGRFAEVERALSVEMIASLDDSLRREPLVITLPKFSFTSPSLKLKPALTALGMKRAFYPEADFSGISEHGSLFLDNVYHKASITVNEEGTVAAAATVLPKLAGLPSDNPIEFTANRPFIFIIRDLKTRAIIFMGRVVDPSE